MFISFKGKMGYKNGFFAIKRDNYLSVYLPLEANFQVNQGKLSNCPTCQWKETGSKTGKMYQGKIIYR